MKTPITVSIDSRTSNMPRANTLTTVGSIEYLRDRYILSFFEEPGGYETTITVRGDVTWVCRGDMPMSALMLIKGKRCEYLCNIGGMPIKLNVCTKELNNTIKGFNGSLFINYRVDMCGNTVEDCRITYSISPAVPPS